MARLTNPYDIPNKMFAEQRDRLSSRMRTDLPNDAAGVAAVFQGAAEVPRNYTDTTYVFLQDSYFQYLFNYEVPDCMGIVAADGRAAILIPRLPAQYAVWLGKLPTPESVKAATGVSDVYYTDELATALATYGVRVAHVMRGTNTDSGLNVLTPAINVAGVEVRDDYLYEVVSNQRVLKTALEVQLLTYANKVSSEGHIVVLQHCKPGLSQNHLESTFLHYCYYYGGMRHMSYTCICATGPAGAVLHYPNNDQPIDDGSMALLDMGGTYHCYCSDITCSFPVNGKFTAPQRFVYEAVLDASRQVFRAMRPGVSWVDMHLLSLRVLLSHLIREGLLRGLDVTRAMELYLGRYFMPHGLGHLMGMDVHDVGGYSADAPPRPVRPDATRLRTARVLQAGMCITVEPGLYFNKTLLEEAFADAELRQYFDEERIRRDFWEFGGVRIEDDVVVTEDGILNMTCCPRTVEEVEQTMAGKPFHKEPERFINV